MPKQGPFQELFVPLTLIYFNGCHKGDDITKQSSENVAIFHGDVVGDVGIGLSVRVAQAAAVGVDIGIVNDHDEARSTAVTGDARGSFKDDVIIGVPKTAVIGDAHTVVGGAAIRDGFHVDGSGSSREDVSREEVAASVLVTEASAPAPTAANKLMSKGLLPLLNLIEQRKMPVKVVWRLVSPQGWPLLKLV
ncbi:hypothetical protein AMTR_s00001p00260380 [Amborella trichopoda]|uniref:Uncharacterized protein n=1 Tax=Amborella trichopoda TaxID=13333 RepID=W1NMH6_AMBTC|nr:hypothetical protein AMTR_s00001p00260380 [Amborella trichopoda]